MAVKITEQLGLKNAWQDAAFQQYGFSTVSMEALPKISADTHFFYVVQSNDDAFQTSAVKPLWDNLPFVKAGRAHALGGDTWLFGGPLSAEVLVDIVVKALAADTSAGSGRVIKLPMGETVVPGQPAARGGRWCADHSKEDVYRRDPR